MLKRRIQIRIAPSLANFCCELNTFLYGSNFSNYLNLNILDMFIFLYRVSVHSSILQLQYTKFNIRLKASQSQLNLTHSKQNQPFSRIKH